MYNTKIIREDTWNRGNTFYWKVQFEYEAECEKFRGVRTVIESCEPEPCDKMKPDFGHRFARVKAYKQMYSIAKRLMLLETHQPEWKKKQKMSFEAICLKDDNCLGFVLTGIQDRDRVLKEVNRKFDAGKDIKVTIEEI